MKKCVYLLISLLLVACGQMEQKSACKVNLILDTDMAPDYDDVGAMALMYALADSGQVNVLATVGSNKDENVAPCIEVINRYFNRPDMPVGTPKGEAPSRTTWHQGKRWTEHLPAAYSHKIAKSSEAPTLVKILSHIPIFAASAGTKDPICAISTIRAVCLIYVDFPAIFGPVIM